VPPWRSSARQLDDDGGGLELGTDGSRRPALPPAPPLLRAAVGVLPAARRPAPSLPPRPRLPPPPFPPLLDGRSAELTMRRAGGVWKQGWRSSALGARWCQCRRRRSKLGARWHQRRQHRPGIVHPVPWQPDPTSSSHGP
jgi:hypothetical protein